MKNLLKRMKCVAFAALTLGLAFGARAENVAEVMIGGTTTAYDTISDAWSACNGNNATLKLLKDVDITSALNKNWATDLSLDLNGHTLKQTGTDRIITVHYEMTVSNGVLTRSDGKYGNDGAGIYVCHNDDEQDLTQLVMRGVTMTNCVTTGNGGAIYVAKDTQVMLENCTLRQNAAGVSGGAICTEGGQTADGTSPKDPWDKLVLISTVITDNTAGTSGAGVYYKYTVKGGSCFVAGTKVLMADGTDKKIEEIAEGDIVCTFDHEGGTNSTAVVFMTVKEPITTQIFVLTFADGYGVRCVLSHDFLMRTGDDACEYVCLSRQNAADYVGKSFYAADGKWHELLSVTDGETVNEVYEIYTAQHLNSYADGLLTVPADVAQVLNVYKLGADLKADAEQLAADVAQYGLAEFDEISSKYGMSRAYYDAFGVKYGYVIIGKGLMTRAQSEALYRSTGRAVSPLTAAPYPAAAKGLAALPKLTTSSDEDDPLKDYPVGNLTLGTGTIVTNNLVGSKPNSIYLDHANNVISPIALANDRAGICAGVTSSYGDGRFTAFHYANPGDIALFRSDNADYAVWYEMTVDGSILKIAAGSQIVPPAVANTTYEIWADGELVAQNEGTTVVINTGVKVVYTADDGYVFDGSGATTREVGVDTSKSVATMTPPDTPFEPVASVTASGVTTVYGTLTGAWADATNAQHNAMNAHVTLLADAAVEATLRTSDNGVLTLDLNDHVLAYVGVNNESIIHRWASTLHVVDTAQTRTPRYFACDETGLWALTNEVTDRVVRGGLLTGGRAGAITHELGASGGPHAISNVNFVGNWSSSNGGAVSTPTSGMVLTIAASAFLGNVASGNGGAISAAGSCEMADCRVEANVAQGLGGGLYLKYKGSLVRTEVVGNTSGTGGGVCLTYNPGGCFPAGVKILMADGSEKAVEEIAEGDVVATFDHLGGTNSSAAVFYVYRGTGAQNVFTLSFASGAKLDVADRHDLLLETTRKYVTVSADNAHTYLGKRFYNYAAGSWDELTGVTAVECGDAHYSLYVRGHANCVANGMLTVPDDKDCFVNVYELDENLKADAAQLAADIAAYGLAEPADYPNVPLDDFADGNVRYAHIAIGKGLTTQAEILYWNEFDYGPAVTKKAKSALKLTTSADAVDAPSIPYLQVGEGVVVTGNVNTASADNVYLMSSEAYGTRYNPVIDILPDTADLDIGVALSTGSGVFGWTNAVNYASSFFSDNPSYDIVYTADKTLELVPFVTVVPRSVEHTVVEVYQGETKLESEPYLVLSNAAPVTVVYTADDGYVFADGSTAVTNAVDTSTNPATADAPDAPTKLTVKYVAPVYVGNVASNGIAYWTTNSVSAFTAVESSASAVTWGTAGATNWFVVKDADVQVDGGVTCAGHVNLILCEGAKLVVTNVPTGYAGIATDNDGSFTVYGQPDGEGELASYGGRYGAGIGGCNYKRVDGSNITVNGGRVTAVGGFFAAGIGGGSGGSASHIAINGGVVMASCAIGGVGACIGGGYGGEGVSDIVLNAGKVYLANPQWSEEGDVCQGPFIGSDVYSGSGSGVIISKDVDILFNLTGKFKNTSASAPDIGSWIEPQADMPADFKGLVLLVPDTLASYGLYGRFYLATGLGAWTAATTFAITNAQTGATDEIDIGEKLSFASTYTRLFRKDENLIFSVELPELWIDQQPDVTNGYAVVARTDGNKGITNYIWSVKSKSALGAQAVIDGAYEPRYGKVEGNTITCYYSESYNEYYIELQLLVEGNPYGVQGVPREGELHFTCPLDLSDAYDDDYGVLTRGEGTDEWIWRPIWVEIEDTEMTCFTVFGKGSFELKDVQWIYTGFIPVIEGADLTAFPVGSGVAGETYQCELVYAHYNTSCIGESEPFTFLGSVCAIPTPVERTTWSVYTNGFLSIEDNGVWAAWTNETATVVYTADDGYVFADGSTVVTNTFDTTKNPATADAPDAPLPAVAAVTKTGVTTYYLTIDPAWTDAQDGTESDPATLTLLTNIVLTSALVVSPEAFLTVEGGVLTGAACPAFVCTNGCLTLRDIVVTGGEAAEMGAVIVGADGLLSLAGKTVIDGNKAGERPANLYLTTNAVVSIAADMPLDVGAKIGVTTAEEPADGAPVAVTTPCDETTRLFFASDAEAFTVSTNAQGCVVLATLPRVDDVPVKETEKTETPAAENPDPSTIPEETWSTATNMVSTVVTVNTRALVEDEESKQEREAFVAAAKKEAQPTDEIVVKDEVKVIVTPTGVRTAVGNKVAELTVDVSPVRVLQAMVNGVVTTNETCEIDRGEQPILIEFDVSGFANVPMLIEHKHGGTILPYTPGDEATLSTFAYDPLSKTVRLLMQEFSEVTIYDKIRVGDDAWAVIYSDGICDITGTTDMWSTNKPGASVLWGSRDHIGSVVVTGGVTSVGKNVFAYMKGVRNVTIGGSVTNVEPNAFCFCLNVTNVVIGANVRSIGANAFARCNSLKTIRFVSAEVAEACQGTAFKVVAAIRLVDGKPEVVCRLPDIVIDGYNKVLKGCANLGDNWEPIGDVNDIPEECHFFKYEFVPEE